MAEDKVTTAENTENKQPEKEPYFDSKMKRQSIILAVVCVAALVCQVVFHLK